MALAKKGWKKKTIEKHDLLKCHTVSWPHLCQGNMDMTGQRHAYLPDKTCLEPTEYRAHTLCDGGGVGGGVHGREAKRN